MLTRDNKSEETQSPEDFRNVEAWLAAYWASGDFHTAQTLLNAYSEAGRILQQH